MLQRGRLNSLENWAESGLVGMLKGLRKTYLKARYSIALAPVEYGRAERLIRPSLDHAQRLSPLD